MKLDSRRLLAVSVAALMVLSACSSAATPAPTAAPSAAPTAAPSAAPTAASTAAPSTASCDVSGKKVALVNYGSDGYQQGQAAWFTKAAEADGAQVTVVDGKGDLTVQIKAIDDFIAAKVDGIAWDPADPSAVVETTKAVQAAGIPLLWVEAGPGAGAGATAPLAMFNDQQLTKEAGVMAAKYVTEVMKQTPKVVAFDLLTFPTCVDLRIGGFIEGVKSVSPDAEVVFHDEVPYDRNGAMAKMEDVLQASPDFNIFIGCGSEQVIGGILGLEAAGRGKAVDKKPATEWIVTIDGTPAELERLLDPNSAVVETITMTPKENGTEIWAMLKSMMCGELAPTDGTVVDLPGLFMPKDCEEVSAVYEEQYGMTNIYTPLDCSKYQ